MSPRIKRFTQLPTDPHYGKICRRLKAPDVEFAKKWLADHDHLNKDEFEKACNRMFLDKPELREQFPRWCLILEVVHVTNVSAVA